MASNPALGGAMGRSILRLSRKAKKQKLDFKGIKKGIFRKYNLDISDSDPE